MSEVSNLFVVGMGVGTVFVGLICIVILCLIMSLICRATDHKSATPAATAAAPAAAQVVENRQEIIAAVSAAAAEEMGTDISAIRILSFKKL